MAYILIVDQDDIAADLAAGMLASAGHVCGTATDPAQAWRMLHWRRPDVLLLDEAMHGDNGSTFLNRLRVSPGFDDLPVLVLTEPDKTAPDCIGKPLQPALLRDRVACLLESAPAKWAEFHLHHGKEDSPRKVYL